MKIYFSPYELVGKHMTRQGVLLRFEYEDETIGHADCHPWPEFGDEPLSKQLDLLKEGITTPLTKRSLHYAYLDAKARAEKVNLFDGLSIPKSNFTVPKLDSKTSVQKALEEGFTSFKIKVGSDLDHEIPLLLKLLPKIPSTRLDFNGKLSAESFEKVLCKLGPVLDRIEYCEDPFPYNSKSWNNIQNKYGMTLACDHNSTLALNKPDTAKVIILKPAVQESVQPIHQDLVVTSYLDHPIGQLTAAYIAANLKTITCGLLTHRIYEKNDFSALLSQKGPDLKPPKGYGFGFDDLLEKTKWRALTS